MTTTGPSTVNPRSWGRGAALGTAAFLYTLLDPRKPAARRADTVLRAVAGGFAGWAVARSAEGSRDARPQGPGSRLSSATPRRAGTGARPSSLGRAVGVGLGVGASLLMTRLDHALDARVCGWLERRGVTRPRLLLAAAAGVVGMAEGLKPAPRGARHA
ncbi:hypothetical protein GCM10009595_09310 [Falsarthrobacter nasiphocae]